MARSAAALARRAEKRGVPLELQKLKDAPRPANSLKNLNALTPIKLKCIESADVPNKVISTDSIPKMTAISTPLTKKNEDKVNNITNTKTSDKSISKQKTSSTSSTKVKLIKKDNKKNDDKKRKDKITASIVDKQWHCHHCNNNNFHHRSNCNRCQRLKDTPAVSIQQ